VSHSTAAVSKLGYDDSFARVAVTVHGAHPFGDVEEVAQIPWLGVDALSHLGGVGIDKVGGLFVDRLMLFPGQPHQVAH